jgi:hypothetical protein
LATVTLALGCMLCATAPAFASPVSPTVTKVDPAHGPVAGGTHVTIAGSNFIAVNGVNFGSRKATSFEVKSSTEIVAVSPPWASGNAIAEVTIETVAAGASSPSGGDSFIYEPTVTKIEPATGPAAGGTTVKIAGEAFEGLFTNGAGEMPPFVSSVRFGTAKAASFKVESSTQITAVSPPGAGTANVTVTTLGGSSALSPADQFAYPPALVSIEGESVSHVASTDATLEAKIDPESLERGAYYQFQIVANPSEYLQVFACPTEGFPANSSLCGGSLASQVGALPIGKIGPGVQGQTVSLDLSAPRNGWPGITTLKPSTTYHYRAIAARVVLTEDTIQWEEPIVYGADQTFTTPEETARSNGPGSGTGSQGSGLGSGPTGSTGAHPKDGTGPRAARGHRRHHRRRHRHHRRRHRHHRAHRHNHHHHRPTRPARPRS